MKRDRAIRCRLQPLALYAIISRSKRLKDWIPHFVGCRWLEEGRIRTLGPGGKQQRWCLPPLVPPQSRIVPTGGERGTKEDRRDEVVEADGGNLKSALTDTGSIECPGLEAATPCDVSRSIRSGTADDDLMKTFANCMAPNVLAGSSHEGTRAAAAGIIPYSVSKRCGAVYKERMPCRHRSYE